MNTIRIAHETPEGVTVSTSAYEASHGAPVNLIGCWAFAPAAAPAADASADDSGVLCLNGSLTETIDSLPAGQWVLLP